MASFLYPCVQLCGKMVRTTSPVDKPITCDRCVEAIAANKAEEAKRRANANRRQRRTEERQRQSRPPRGEWVHKGGGYYENTVTGKTRRGRAGTKRKSV